VVVKNIERKVTPKNSEDIIVPVARQIEAKLWSQQHSERSVIVCGTERTLYLLAKKQVLKMDSPLCRAYYQFRPISRIFRASTAYPGIRRAEPLAGTIVVPLHLCTELSDFRQSATID
jgi:hypothetical protein